VLVTRAEAGKVTVGTDLFNFTNVLVGDIVVATAQDPAGAQFVRGVLLHDPETDEVDVPTQPMLDHVILAWTAECTEWQEAVRGRSRIRADGIPDQRLRSQIRDRSLTLLHAQ
jgi:hypothetical protein